MMSALPARKKAQWAAAEEGTRDEGLSEPPSFVRKTAFFNLGSEEFVERSDWAETRRQNSLLA